MSSARDTVEELEKKTPGAAEDVLYLFLYAMHAAGWTKDADALMRQTFEGLTEVPDDAAAFCKERGILKGDFFHRKPHLSGPDGLRNLDLCVMRLILPLVSDEEMLEEIRFRLDGYLHAMSRL
jgi:hypothetical protein